MMDRLDAMLDYNSVSKVDRKATDEVQKAGDATRARIGNIFDRQHKITARLRSVGNRIS